MPDLPCCRRLAAALAAALALSTFATFGARTAAQAGQEQHPPAAPEVPARYREPIPLYTVGLGTFARPISSKNAEAQAYFNQGMQLMYAFGKADAVRSFRMARTRDPECAICYWGEAWAWGSYLNGPMTAAEAPHAWAALQEALKLKDRAPAMERALIEALSVRYVETFDAAKRVEQDRAYAGAMAKLAETYPDDLDVLTLYADALFLLEPRRGRRDVNAPNIKRLHGVLEAVLAKDIRHPGACHLYVHATESTILPGKAEACAEFLGNSIPGASHINHMPTHTFNVIGRWGDSVRGNIQAVHSDQAAAAGEGFAIYPEHNLHMLFFAASYDGQGAISIQAAKDYAKRGSDASFHALALVRFGRFDEVGALTVRPRGEVNAALWDFAHAYAKLRLGKVDEAKADLEKLKQVAESSRATLRMHPARVIVGTVAGILEGELARRADDLPAAIAAFERAVALEDEIGYDEPEPLPFAARHWLGAALVEAKRYADAERVYLEDLADHPRNGWSLFGLRQALAGQQKSTADVDKALALSWARSDTRLTASRF